MIQGGNNYEEALQLLPKTISAKNGECARKTESISTGCLYRVPDELRKLNESAYTPRHIAIGPLHQNDKHLQTPMQQVKKSYANHLLHRLTEGIEDPGLAERTKFTLLQECAAEMKMSMDEAQKCYAEDVMLDEEMMLVDGCFILEILYRFYESRNIPKLEEEQEEKPIRASTSSSPLLSPHLQVPSTRLYAAKLTRREEEARFEIPTLAICDPTEAILRNLIAFEQCCPGVSQHFTSYAFLMDMLVSSDKDVELLKKAGVVCNYLVVARTPPTFLTTCARKLF